jgi:hypothetical protein
MTRIENISTDVPGANYRKIEACRVAGSRNLVSVLNIGHQALTGVFPKSRDDAITNGPLELVWCPDSGLLQLAHSFQASELYGENYGNRSGLNQSMVRHLTTKIGNLERRAGLSPGDVVLDLGSNDATSLKAYTVSGLKRIGIDPTGAKFKKFYPDDVTLVPDFFSATNFRSVANKAARIVTSIAMFYDPEDPIAFAREVVEVLADDGIWHFEQSYMPSMLRLCSYDTICHEHIEYYSLTVVRAILDAADMKILDVQMNSVNGGSFAVDAIRKTNDRFRPNHAVVDWLLEQEERWWMPPPRSGLS